MKRFCALLVAVGLGVVQASDKGEIVNPILPGLYSDPTVCKGADGRFYLMTSALQYFPGNPTFVSDNLVDWKLIGHAFDKPEMLPMTDHNDVTGLFATTLRYAEGKYHLVTRQNGFDEHGIRVGNLYGTSQRPEGPWTFRKAKLPGADPSIDYIDGKWHYTACNAQGIIYGEFDPQCATLKGPHKLLWAGEGGPWPEGSHLFKRGKWYYLIMAEGGTQYGHRAIIARSAKVDGPYEGCPHNPILTHARAGAEYNVFQGLGHGDFVVNNEGQWYFIFHAFRRQDSKHHLLGRETMLAKVDWSADDWPIVNGGKPISNHAFNTSRLPERDWVWVRQPDLSRYSIQGNCIKLIASKLRLNDFGSPTFVGTRQTAIDQTFAATLVDLGDGVETGLVAYQNRRLFHALVIRKVGMRRVAFLRSVLADKIYEERAVEVGDGELCIKVVATAKRYSFLVNDREIAFAPARLISAEVDDTFGGVIFGLFAVGEGTVDYKIQ